MSNRQTVRNLKVGDFVPRQAFLVTNVKEMVTKNGKLYITFSAEDKTGTLNCVCWDPAAAAITFNTNSSFCGAGLKDLSGEITEFNGKIQFKVSGMWPSSETNLALFERRSQFDESVMWGQFLDFAVLKYKNKTIANLASRIVDKYAEPFMAKPAATGMHHAFKHGLLEHTLQMLQTAEKLFELPFYADALNKDYCYFGIMFHDFMKIFEYGDGPDFKKTRLGILVPHIPKMAAIIEVEGRALGMDEELLTYLQSIVLSHHRFMEWGSPCKPASPEALFVHYVDNLHGDVFGAIQKLDSDTSNDDSVRYGYGEQAYVLVKKRFSEVIGEGSTHEKTELTNQPAGEEDHLVGF